MPGLFPRVTRLRARRTIEFSTGDAWLLRSGWFSRYSAAMTQQDLFGNTHVPQPVGGDPDRVRRKLHAILAEARAAEVMPWDDRDLLYYKTVVPQMTNWLPEDEAAQMRFAFAEEVKRLELAA